MRCHPVMFGTRIVNAGLPTDPASIMLVGQHKGLAFGIGDPLQEGDLVVLRSPPFPPEPFFLVEAHEIPSLKGFAKLWIGHVESLLKYKK